MHWILQNNLFHEKGMEELRDTLERQGIPHSEHKVIPFIGELQPDINPPAGDRVICFGSYSMWRVAEKRQWRPGVFRVPGLTTCIGKWGNHLMLNGEESIVCQFKDVDKKLQCFGDDIFIRPIEDSKYFAGMVITPAELCIWREKVVDLGEDDGTGLRGNTLVLMTIPRDIYQEYRFWIVDNKVITSSMYRMGGRVLYHDETATPPGANGLANIIASDFMWQPARAYCVDICLTDYDQWKVVEINNINSAGLYAANVPKLVDALQNMEF